MKLDRIACCAARATVVIAALLTAACRTIPDPATAGPSDVELYQRGKFAEAQSAAAARARQLTAGPEREQALLIAGQAAYAQEHNVEAEGFLRQLLDSMNPPVAGKAAAVLGLIQQESAMHNRAIDLFRQAQGKLAGDDAARAYIYAGDSYRALDKTTEAKASYQAAAKIGGTDPILRAMIADRLSGGPAVITPAAKRAGGFTLQLGAFSSLQRAQATADRQRPRFATAGLGSPRIVETVSRGKRTYVVQVGRYPTRPAAETAKARFGGETFVTMADD